MKYAIAVLASLIAFPVLAQNVPPVAITITLDPAEYQTALKGLGALTANESFSLLVKLINAQQAAQKSATEQKPATDK